MSFSHKPEVLAEGPDGLAIASANHHIILGSQTQGQIAYTPGDNVYWAAVGKPMNKERFEKDFLPYLSWQFDVIEEIEGKMVNVFPPSPENIALKRMELIQVASKEGKVLDQKTLQMMTSPAVLKNKESFEKLLEKFTPDEDMARRLNRTR